MNPGVMDRKILIQRQTKGLPLTDASGNILTSNSGNVITTNSRKDSYGQEVDVWGTRKDRWAKKIEQKATETERRPRFPVPPI